MIISITCRKCNVTGTYLQFGVMGKAYVWVILLRKLPTLIIEGSVRLQVEVGGKKNVFFAQSKFMDM